MSEKETLTITHRFGFWIISALLITGFIWLFQSILTPFILGAIIAYILNPAVKALEKIHLNRIAASVLLTLAFVLSLAGAFVMLIPLVIDDLITFANKVPAYVKEILNAAEPVRRILQDNMQDSNGDFLKQALQNTSGNIIQFTQTVLKEFVSGGFILVNFISLIVITPFVTFFMMMEWPEILKWFKSVIPRNQYETVSGLVQSIDTKISGFIRGQLIIALILAIVYTVALKLAGLEFALLLGLGAGILSIIPLIGSLSGMLAGAIVAWFQTYDILFTLLIAGIFAIGQFVEGNVLTPKIIGDKVGLHPLWILFSLMAGGAVFGITGMLLSVPVAAIISVLTGFALSQYKQSSYYSTQ